jgi:Na+-transporting NADH:ubiquinone oxidoreductase subunit C
LLTQIKIEGWQEMDSVGKTVGVAAALCIVCSILVSTTSVKLKPLQIKNKQMDMKKNILSAAGLLGDGTDIESVYKSRIEEKMVDFSTGSYSAKTTEGFDLQKAEANPDTSIKIEKDFAGLGRRAKESIIYIIKDEAGQKAGLILPIRSQGLWALMYGFIALKNDAKTVVGFQYYQQGETPGLGAEVNNPKWKAQWVGKLVFDESNAPKISLVKLRAAEGSSEANHQIDALSGATITSNGVQNSLRYWLSNEAFGKFLSVYRGGQL